MKLPSINYLLANARVSFLRFPLTIISATLAVIVGIYLTECQKSITNIFPYINFLLCAALGIPLYFCAVIVCDKTGFNRNIYWLIMLFATAALACIYLTLPGSDSTHNTSLPYVKYAIYNVIIHLLVSFLPFLSSTSLNGYWQYNKILFIRVWASLLYSGVLYIGLALALLSLKLLFDIQLHDELFFDIYLVVAGLINTWFFVSGIPSDLNHLDGLAEYPKGLKIFSQYVLLPLLALFLLILYVYGGKILVFWQWPKGIVSNLIVSISVLGILTFLLLHPYSNTSGNGWIRIASRGYYFALIPLIIILFIAIGMRTGEYGITVSRYVILLLGVWLGILCIYTALGKTNIKFIPASLAIMLVLMSFGPWGMFSASERSQVNRLHNILETAGILKGGKINNEPHWATDSLSLLVSTDKEKNENLLNDSLHNEVYSILHYLDDHHGFLSLREWYSQDLDSILTLANSKKEKYNQQDEADLYMLSMGLKAERIYKDAYNANSTNYHTEVSNITVISGYDYMTQIDFYGYNSDSLITTITLDSIPYTLYYTAKRGSSLFIKSADETIHFPFKDLTDSLRDKFGIQGQQDVSINEMNTRTSGQKFDFKAELNYLTLGLKTDTSDAVSFSGKLFIKRK